MTFISRRWFCWLGLLAWIAAGSATASETDYVRSVKPLLAKRCYACHGAWKQNGGFRLDTGESIRKGGESGPAVVAGKSSESLLIAVLSGSAGFRMPPENEGAPLSADEIAVIAKWIDSGAQSPPGEKPAADPRSYWSYQPVRVTSVPVDWQRLEWPASPIDSFLAAKHQEHGVTPRPEAPRAVLFRRTFLDLIGLPPTREELDEFLADDRPDALHRVVDKLLASPLYGQRWGRHWMDVWRYSDWYGSRGGNEIRYSQRHIWRWRDWIVESLNADKGYDRMVIEMIAGDELSPGDPDIARATGFLGRNWYKFDRNVWMFETVEQPCQAFLGLTMKCARCHDHKFDPISQRDYYQLRAFFEPHDVRTDPVSSQLDTEKDATLGEVLKNGVAYVYDKQLDVPTYLFERGDGRVPKKEDPLAPGLPAALGGEAVRIEPVTLPDEVVAPYLRPDVIRGALDAGRRAVGTAEEGLEAANATLRRAVEQADLFAKGELPTSNPAVLFEDAFDSARPDIWRTISGQWEFASGKVTQNEPSTFPTMAANIKLPRDFAARLKYKTLETGEIHSVGIFFDVTGADVGDCQAIYTATNNTKASVQAFHRSKGQEHYPAAGIFPCDLKLNESVTMDFAVRGQQLNVWLNGKLKLVYTMPVPRSEGSFALWTHSASAEFDELRVMTLPDACPLAKTLEDHVTSPMEPPSAATLEIAKRHAREGVVVAEKQLNIARSELSSLESRIAADRAKVQATADAEQLAKQASKAQRQLAVLKGEIELFKAEQALTDLKFPANATVETPAKLISDAEAKVNAAKKTLESATAELAKEDVQYTSLGPVYPRTSTGRRLALAKWIASPRNRRTSRVAVNHIWLRHFGEALVPTVANFGLNGKQPSHPELLDWLAGTFVADGWSMKRLHRELVLSSAYRMGSTEGPADSTNVASDPTNRWLWRMNTRRAESEVVRDSALYVAGELDLSFGGPEIPESNGMESRRRSMYFRSTPNEKMTFLELFDQANPNECYRRQESVIPQQSLALFNSSLSLEMARKLSRKIQADNALSEGGRQIDSFIHAAFKAVLSRAPDVEEIAACRRFLERHVALLKSSPQDSFPSANPNVPSAGSDPLSRAAENLVHILMNHNDFVTIR